MQFDFQEKEEGLTPFRKRLLFAFGGVLVLFLVLVARFAWLQILNRDAYVERAERNRTVTVTTQGSRGLIFDRNGEALAKNDLGYSLEIVPDQVQNLSRTIDELSRVIPITQSDRRRFRRLREDLNRYDSIPIRLDLTDEEVAVFIAQKHRFPGVSVNQHEYRRYPAGSTGSHFLGYIGSISQGDKRRLESEGTLPLYEGIRQIGKVGLERSYENLLHSTPGFETLEVTASGRSVRTLEAKAPKPGKNLELTIDMNLQRLVEKSLEGREGVVIAIDPRTGGILSFASLPTYDPNLFPEGIDPESWNELSSSERKPLFNRAVRGLYPIGSAYKPFMALAGLAMNETTVDYVFNDTGVFTVGKHRFRDLTGAGKGRVDVRKSIQVSSDVYYYWLSMQLGVDRIHDFMSLWGFGQKTGIDLVGEQAGVLPNREWKERRFGEPWYLGDTPSIGIGQGYNAFTILQLASATATLASRGTVMTPHLVNRIVDPVTGEATQVAASPVRKIDLPRAYWNAVIGGMRDVTTKGTARSVFKDVPYSVAGKTGTAQVITIAQDDKYSEEKLERRYHDHSLFIAFAPVENPKIALAVLVENSGFGAKTAAPVAKEVLDYWLTGKNRFGLPHPKHLPPPRAAAPQPRKKS